MTYLTVKVLHLCVVFIWVAGIFIQVIGLKVGESLTNASKTPHQELSHFYQWDRMITLPAMTLVFLTGPYLAFAGHWIGQKWLIMKVAVVIGLAASHGINAGKLRRLYAQASTTRRSSPDRRTLFILAAVLLIVGLVIFKL